MVKEKKKGKKGGVHHLCVAPYSMAYKSPKKIGLAFVFCKGTIFILYQC